MASNAKSYIYFQPKLRDNTYRTGDAYDDGKIQKYRAEWDIVSDERYRFDKPYLKHVKKLATDWRHLGLLADFMEVGTTPVRWEQLHPDPQHPENDENRKRRLEKVNVRRLDYPSSGAVKTPIDKFKSFAELETALEQEPDNNTHLRLYVVEDLSRDVIELLGNKYDIDPAFFRSHIFDFAWSNVRDPWREPPSLVKDSIKRNWTQIRYVTPRYFETSDDFTKATDEAGKWNVPRRPDDDNNKAFWDKPDAIVALTRLRASFWLQRADNNRPAIGILLLDPSIKGGLPLWRGRRNWQTTPSVHDMDPPPSGPSGDSFFEDFLYWAQKPEFFNPGPLPDANNPRRDPPGDRPSNVHVPMQVLLQLICAEWLTIADYINSRLSQIDWEIAFPENFLEKREIGTTLRKLHMWRRFVPLYREMLSETLERVFHFPCLGGGVSSGGPEHEHPVPGSIGLYRHDFELALARMKEYQERIDRLTTVVTAVMGIANNERAIKDNRNIGRLTWLATIFLPFSLIATTFCMQPNVTGMTRETVKWYFIASLPFTAVVILVAYLSRFPVITYVLPFKVPPRL